MHEQLMHIKSSVSEQIQNETVDLKEEILNVKKYFDEQKDHVTQFDSTINFLKREVKN